MKGKHSNEARPQKETRGSQSARYLEKYVGDLSAAESDFQKFCCSICGIKFVKKHSAFAHLRTFHKDVIDRENIHEDGANSNRQFPQNVLNNEAGLQDDSANHNAADEPEGFEKRGLLAAAVTGGIQENDVRQASASV